ncbi:hypothetical protein F4775DRAFT_545845 [Biscogniauxia sp. FL1348]|nr:hypothetical protein F4775DRAFT_545845 [Biscogniauxia sp. FL1348]
MHVLRFCVLPRCLLCRFPILEGGQFVAMTDDGLKTAQYAYRSGMPIYDSTLGLKICPCQNPCSHSWGIVNGYHPECIALGEHMPRETFEWSLRVTEYSFEPLESEQSRRQSYLPIVKDASLAVLCVAKGLPEELRSTINKLLDCRDWAIRPMVIPPKQVSPPNTFDIDISLGIWAQHVLLDGIRYISALSNTEKNNARICVLAADKAQDVDTLYVLHDHLGVRQMRFTAPGHNIESPGSSGSMGRTWWEIISLSTKTVRVKSDGLKLRRITDSTRSASTESYCITWSVPMPRNQIASLYIHPIGFTLKSKSPEFLRMVPLKLNSKKLTGISVCWKDGPIAIYGHKKGEKPPVYSNLEKCFRDPVWIYTPLDNGEIIVSMWLSDSSDVSLTVETNKGRVVTIGYYKETGPETRPDRQVLKATERASRIYFDDSPMRIRYLATSSPPATGRAPSRKASSTIPRSEFRKSTIYTSASLCNVSEVVPYSRADGDHSRITGLLFRYSDGTSASVGDFRLDGNLSPLQVGSSKNLFIGIIRHVDGYDISRIRVVPPEHRGSLSWLEWPWEGEIEWLFSPYSTRVYHSSRRSQELQ